MNNKKNVANAVEAVRNHIILVGKELELASGIRALAAERIMRRQGISDSYQLYDACEDLIGTANLCESYSGPLNVHQGALVLGQGHPFPSLEAYIALRELYGDTWVATAIRLYLEYFGTKVKLGSTDIPQVVQKLVMRAHICFEYDMVWWNLPTRTPDGYGRYDRTKRIEALNRYLAETTFNRAA